MASYSLTISNPAIKTASLTAATTASATPNTAYLDQPGGNDIDLTISNKSGETLTFSTDPADGLVLLQVSINIMDGSGASKLKAVKPWSLRIPNSSDPDPASDDDHYNFYLSPSTDVSIDDKSSGVISLTDFEAFAKDTGDLQLCFTSDQDPITIYNQLIISGAPQEGLPYLLSDALIPYVYVNTKQSSTIIVSELPLTDTDTIENVIQVRFVLQAGPGGLISSWTKLPTPTFRISFPYSTYASDATTEYDLTDCLLPGDKDYHDATSARNIVATVQYPYADPTNPPVENDFWQITQIGDAKDKHNLPSWVITPLTTNQSLFTSPSKKSLDADPGPELNIWLSHIFSALPLSECNSTLIYIHWQDFPGFNDGFYVLPLTKELLTIDSFSITIAEEITGPQLNFQWTANADSCAVEGAAPLTGTTSMLALSHSQPLRSSYTLTAIASNKVTQLSRTLSAEWNINSGAFKNGGPNDFYINPTSLHASADGQYLLVEMARSYSDNTAILRFVDPVHLDPSNLAPIVSPWDEVLSTALAPDGYSFYWVDNKNLYGYNLKTSTALPGSAASNYSAGFFIGFAPKGIEDFLVVTCDLEVRFDPGATPAIYRYNSSLQLVSSEVWPVEECYMVQIGSNGTWFAATPTSLVALDSGLKTIATNNSLTGIGRIVPSASETYVYTLSVDLASKKGILSKLDGATLKTIKQVTTPVIWDPEDYFADDITDAPLILSADEQLIFLAGVDGEKYLDSGKETIIPQFLIYSTNTLEQPGWAANIQPQQLQIVRDLTLSAFGHRIYGTGTNIIEDGPDFLFSVDASFPNQ